MKIYKDTVEVERSEDFISWLVIEELTIGDMYFFIRQYILEDGNDVLTLFGVFTDGMLYSPVFEHRLDCFRHAMSLYNENYKHRHVNGKNCLGDTTKNSKRG